MPAIAQVKKGMARLEFISDAQTNQLSCTFFQWAEFDEDGEPPWATNAVKE